MYAIWIIGSEILCCSPCCTILDHQINPTTQILIQNKIKKTPKLIHFIHAQTLTVLRQGMSVH
jgi:alkyl sulfatase BDS1-like metallo-beta-lactamase superfamily hydrolase